MSSRFATEKFRFNGWKILCLIAMVGFAPVAEANAPIITTAVGRGIGDGGPALEAILRFPSGMALHDGAIYIADRENWRIRKVDPASGVIQTVAGNGLSCFTFTAPDNCGDGGPATAARIQFTAGMALDEEGNLYLSNSNRIRRVDAITGVINTFAGNGTRCSPTTGPCGDNGPAALANIAAGDLTVKNGQLYMADNGHNRVRKIDLETGIITTVAGTGEACPLGTSPCDTGGLATASRITGPKVVELDDEENLYIVEQGGHNKIRKVDANTGIISVYAGIAPFCSVLQPEDPCGTGGPAAAARFNSITDLAVAGGTLYASDLNDRVRQIDLATTIITNTVGTGVTCPIISGSCGDGGPAVHANLNDPLAIAHDGNRLYIEDAFNNRIRKVESGIITAAAGMTGKGDGGQAINARLDTPDASVLDCDGKHFLVESANFGGNWIRQIDMATGVISTVAGDGFLCFPLFSPNSCGDDGPAVAAPVSAPRSVTCDSTGTAIYFAETGRVRKIDLGTGIISPVAGTGQFGFNGDDIPATTARLMVPSSVIERDGNLYIAESQGHRIRRVAPDGIITTVVGTGTSGSGGDGGPASEATISGPEGLDFDAAGNLLITLRGNHSVRMVTPGEDGIIKGDSDEFISRVAGTHGVPGFLGDGGSALLANLSGPDTPVSDSDGTLYFTQFGNHVVSSVNPSGVLSTVAGIGTIAGFFGDGGPATSALLRNPTGIAKDSAKNIYIDDLNNHRVRRLNEAAAYCDIDPDSLNLASHGKWGTMYFEPAAPHTSGQIVKALLYAVDVNGDRISKVLSPESGTPSSTSVDSNGNGVPELMRKFNLAGVQAIVDDDRTADIVMEVLIEDGRYGACSHMIRVLEPPVHEADANGDKS